SNYGEAWNLNGVAAFCLDMICKTPTTQAGSGSILASCGQGPFSGSESLAFGLEYLAADLGFSNSNLGLRFTLTTTSGIVQATTASGVFPTDGTWHHFRFDYDGSHMRIFVDGVAQTLQT